MLEPQKMIFDSNRVTYFAETDSRNRRVKFGVKAKDRTRHIYVIGKTGMGKSTLLENMAIQDIQNGEGMAFIDPHGKTAELFLDYIPKSRIDDVLYFAPFDLAYPISFNVMEDVGADKRHLVANGLMSAFKKIWVDAWSARMEYILNNILLALLEYPGSTLIGVNRMLSDKDYRNAVSNNVKDASVKAFWTQEFAKYSDKFMTEAGAAIQNKIGQFISNPLIRNIIGQPKSTFDIREMMDNKKIIIINLSKGKVGEANANLLGSILITKIYLAAMSRADVPESVLNKLPNFYLYVDEFQSFANESFANILSEARKYKLNLTIAHQYIEQMSEEVRAAVFGNVGTMVTFRVGAFDSEILEKEFAPKFMALDLVNLGFAQIYLKLMIDGVSSQPFSATTLPPIEKAADSMKEMVIEESRKKYARPRAIVEEEILEWHKPVVVARERRDERWEKGSGFKQTALSSVSPTFSKPTLSKPESLKPTLLKPEILEKKPEKIVVSSNELKRPLQSPQSQQPPQLSQSPQFKKEIKMTEHRSALRDALASVKSVKPQSFSSVLSQPVLKSPAVKKEESGFIPLNKLKENIQFKSEEKKEVVKEKEIVEKIVKVEEKKVIEEKKSFEKKEETKKEFLNGGKPDEIPEDVLRKILEVKQ